MGSRVTSGVATGFAPSVALKRSFNHNEPRPLGASGTKRWHDGVMHVALAKTGPQAPQLKR